MSTAGTLKVGLPAPDFRAEAFVAGSDDFKVISLKDFQGKWVCLYFYPRDFTFVCPTEIRAFGEREGDFRELNCELVACSTDSAFSHKAWFERDLPQVTHPVLADTAHHVSRSYDVLIEESGAALRGTFIIDPRGILQWMSVNSLGIGRSVDEVLRVLSALQTGELCPAGWRRGQATIRV